MGVKVEMPPQTVIITLNVTKRLALAIGHTLAFVSKDSLERMVGDLKVATSELSLMKRYSVDIATHGAIILDELSVLERLEKKDEK